MAVNKYVDLDQPQKKCLVDLFNNENRVIIGEDIGVSDVEFGVPSPASVPNANTQVLMSARDTSKIVKGKLLLNYNRLDMGQAPVNKSALVIKIEDPKLTTQDLHEEINNLMGIQLEEGDIVSEEIVLKRLPYGLSNKNIHIADTCLVFMGTLPVRLLREEPIALLRSKVIFPDYDGIEILNGTIVGKTAEVKKNWEQLVALGTETGVLNKMLPQPEDPFELVTQEDETPDRTIKDLEYPLAFWYQLYPESAHMPYLQE